MWRQIAASVLCLLLPGLTLAACGATAPDPTPDLVATGVAVEQAVAATLTAQAPPPPPPTPTRPPNTPPPPPPTPTEATVAEAPPPATDTPAPTPIPPTPTPIPPTAAPRPIFAVVEPDGGRSDLEGVIIIPGYPQEQVRDPVIFREALVFNVFVYDPRIGTRDGDGVNNVKIFITRSSDGELVYAKTENNAAYCIFGGGEPDCSVLLFSQFDRWPPSEARDDQPWIEDDLYDVDIAITYEHGQSVENWVWTFRIDRRG